MSSSPKGPPVERPLRLLHFPRFPRPKRFVKRLALAACALCVLYGIAVRILPRLLPYHGEKALRSLRFSVAVLDAKGNELQVVALPDSSGLRRLFVPYAKTPQALIDIVIRAEDRRFWLHPGFDIVSIARAFWQNVRAHSRVSGASTISMQLARIIRPRERSWQHKMQEIWEAMQLESRLGKQGVLELYLNLLPFGRNAEGFGAAARIFYGRSLDTLSVADLMTLAVIPRSPIAYDPFVNADKAKRAILRLQEHSARTLSRASASAIDRALSAVVDPARPGIWPFRTPQFVRWLQGTALWKTHDTRLPLHTGIEPSLQDFLEKLLADTVRQAEKKRISNAAALFVRPDDMRIAAWVGSVDFNDKKASGQIDGVTMLRQPGSTLKPFIYALALQKGFSAASVLPDIPRDFGAEESYIPSNFNNQCNGPVRLRQALAASLNIPAVYVLQQLGVAPAIALLVANGFSSLESQRDRLGLGLALGNAEVSLFELVQGYGLFLRDGVPVRLQAQGQMYAKAPAQSLQAQPPQVQPLIDPRLSRLIRDILTRYPDRTLVFGRNSNTRLQFSGAMKTGTSNQFNNIWAVGFTPDLLGGIWMGNFSGSTVIGEADSGYPSRVLASSLENFSAHPDFAPLTGLEKRSICSLSGMLAGPLCPHRIEEWFIPGTEALSCDWHIEGPHGPETRYPQEYRAWLAKYKYQIPGEFQQGRARFSRPSNGSIFFINPNRPLSAQEISVEATGSLSGSIYLDGRMLVRGAFPLYGMAAMTRGTHCLELYDTAMRPIDTVNYEVK